MSGGRRLVWRACPTVCVASPYLFILKYCVSLIRSVGQNEVKSIIKFAVMDCYTLNLNNS